ncbi:aminotransferase class V-fold PLP-dependent enzyme [Rhizorhabdus dicambivorans]|uniref:Aminotransferase class V-fold PLP-dependent enzyme n=1 Tax=Rhizorhabdus dicambivorans TaxID=1850238 RepID=A0A2A4FYC3_9SPHN|nr:aminotransferase class V-fold PLP-dependent enzyme [Rhizorhabdus dicambivorans]ATE63615.1 aminotransferase class V-fold PLP-dependent enzyme [Rhizorhabdus dicambivorans]PCE42741.1 aminotransferase class V-fold PLP-dependent enzyme [Rhizorhabdus dicambivorans]
MSVGHIDIGSNDRAAPTSDVALPAKSLFASMPTAYFNSGSIHPLPRGAQRALEAYAAHKTLSRSAAPLDMRAADDRVMALFAGLIGVTPDELAFTQSTTMAENLILSALDLPRSGGRVVTDELHFAGSLYTYARLAQAGVDVVVLPMTDQGTIDPEAMAAAVNDKTKLVAISQVSSLNGFEHDLSAVCALAHAHGAYVYTDIVQAAGAMPLDLAGSGADFAGCASYKWLMGDFGLAFLYARKDVHHLLRPSWWGYYQVNGQKQIAPLPKGDILEPGSYRPMSNAQGIFAMGTMCRTGVAMLDYSLDWISRVGTRALMKHRLPLIDAIQNELRKRGYQPLTPLGSRSPLLAFALDDAPAKLAERLDEHGISLALGPDRFRISLAAFNDLNDVDRLLEALPRVVPS